MRDRVPNICRLMFSHQEDDHRYERGFKRDIISKIIPGVSGEWDMYCSLKF